MCYGKKIGHAIKTDFLTGAPLFTSLDILGSKNFGINGINYKLINRKYSYESEVRREKMAIPKWCLLKT